MRGKWRTADWIRAVMAVLGEGIAPGLWVVAGLVVAGLTLVRIATAPFPGDPAGGPQQLAALGQIVATLILNAVLYRAAAGAAARGRFAPALLRFALLFMLLLLVMLAVLALLPLLLPDHPRLADAWLWSFAVTTLVCVLLLPLAPWQAALAIGDRTLGIGGGWRGLRGRFPGYVGAYLAIVTPCFAVHLALTLLLDGLAPALAGTTLIALVAVDSVASLAQLVLTVGLGAAAWKVARERAAKLDGRPFDN